MKNIFIDCTFDCSFKYLWENSGTTWKAQEYGIEIDYDLVKINDYKSYSFYTFSSLEDFSKILHTAWARAWDKAKNWINIFYKIKQVKWQLICSGDAWFLILELWFFCLFIFYIEKIKNLLL